MSMACGGKIRARLHSDESQDKLPYSNKFRRERSRDLAQKRRTTYKAIMDDLTQALPFPKAVVSQLDYNSRLRLALCFFRLKSLVETSTKQPTIKLEPDMTDLKSRLKLKDQESMQMVKQESKPSRSMPGMLQDMMNEALDGFLMVALSDGTITYLSESIHKHLGLFQSEHIGISMYELIVEDDHETVGSAISKAKDTALARMSSNGGAEIGFFCRMKCSRFKVSHSVMKNPGYKLVYVSGNLKMSGRDPFLVSVVHPVSPPSILEIRMEGNMFVTHYSVDFNCTYFDGRLFNLMGYSKTDLLGFVSFNFHHHDDVEAMLEDGRKILTHGEMLSGYFRFLTRYGFYLWLQARGALVHDSRTGKPSYIECFNFVIGKEKGEKSLLMRNAVAAKEDEDPVIQEVDSKSHDPFPLITHEDGKVVNPLGEDEANVSSFVKNDQPFSSENLVSFDQTRYGGDESKTESSIAPGEVYSSCSDSVGPSSVPVYPTQRIYNTAPLCVGPEEGCIPDSTTSASFSRTNTSNSSRSSDTGYSTSDSASLSESSNGVFSPATGYLSGTSSLSSNSPPVDVTGVHEWTSSPENPPSVFSSNTSGRSVSPDVSDGLSPSSSPDINQAVQPLSNQFKMADSSGVQQLRSCISDTAPSINALLSTETPHVRSRPTPQTLNQSTHSQHGLNQQQLISQVNNTYTNHHLNGASSQVVPVVVSELTGFQGHSQPIPQPGVQGHIQPAFKGNTQDVSELGFQGTSQPNPLPVVQRHAHTDSLSGSLGQSAVSNGQQHFEQGYSGSDIVQMLPAWNDQCDFNHQMNAQGGQVIFQQNFPPQPSSGLSSAQQQPLLSKWSQSSVDYQHGNSLHNRTVVNQLVQRGEQSQQDQMQYGQMQYRQLQRGQLQGDHGTMSNVPQIQPLAHKQQMSSQGYLPVLTGEDLNVLDYIDQVGGNTSANM